MAVTMAPTRRRDAARSFNGLVSRCEQLFFMYIPADKGKPRRILRTIQCKAHKHGMQLAIYVCIKYA